MLLRAPYAAFDEQSWIDSMDLVSAVVSWNIDSGDWLLNGADEQVSTVLDSMTPGNIVLLTDSDGCAEQTLEALPQIIDGLVADGYKIVTLSDLVKTDTALSKKLTSLTKVTMPKNAVFPQLRRGRRHHRVVIGDVSVWYACNVQRINSVPQRDADAIVTAVNEGQEKGYR